MVHRPKHLSLCTYLLFFCSPIIFTRPMAMSFNSSYFWASRTCRWSTASWFSPDLVSGVFGITYILELADELRTLAPDLLHSVRLVCQQTGLHGLLFSSHLVLVLAVTRWTTAERCRRDYVTEPTVQPSSTRGGGTITCRACGGRCGEIASHLAIKDPFDASHLAIHP